MKTHLFKLTCLTDMHVGDGEANYSIIDNTVQKDTVLENVPIIHASGVKGALKEHFEHLWPEKDGRIEMIFGDKDNAGSYKFFTALCVARPLRVTKGNYPYILATDKDILKSFSDFLSGLGLSNFYKYEESKNDKFFVSNVSGIWIEGDEAEDKNNKTLERVIGSRFAIGKTLSNFPLPVRARNTLDENGLSKNLWYEELIPHKSIFYFAVISPTDECDLKFSPDNPVQFGANASIGNGYCTIERMAINE